MTDKPENPPAFPCDSRIRGHDGMTLRDWFAGQAMASMLTGAVGLIGGKVGAYAHGDCNSVIVDRAYTIADAMLAAREQSQ